MKEGEEKEEGGEGRETGIFLPVDLLCCSQYWVSMSCS